MFHFERHSQEDLPLKLILPKSLVVVIYVENVYIEATLEGSTTFTEYIQVSRSDM